MSNNLSPQLLAQLYKQDSEDPFLTLITLTHTSFGTIRLVNNIVDITSRGDVFTAYPCRVVLPKDDGETAREITLDIDNTTGEFIDELRSVTDFIEVKLELVLASIPDAVQMSFEELKIQSVSYNAARISARLFMDGFLTTEMTSEKYNPLNFPGLF